MTLSLFFSCPAAEKHIIKGIRGTGFFWNFLSVINHIIWAEKNNKIPVVYWGSDSLYYHEHGYNGKSNVWEYYFEPLSNVAYEPHDSMSDSFEAPDGSALNWYLHYVNASYRKEINQIIKKFIHVKPAILQKVNEFYAKYIKGHKTIGIHLRGTDKHTEVPSVPFESVLKVIAKYPGYQFFVATDEERLLERAKAEFPGKVIYSTAYRSSNHEPIHYQQLPNKAKLGEEVLIDALLLSLCDLFIHGQSFVAAAVLFFNPQIKNILLESE